jgi:hypothetical protein
MPQFLSDKHRAALGIACRALGFEEHLPAHHESSPRDREFLEQAVACWADGVGELQERWKGERSGLKRKAIRRGLDRARGVLQRREGWMPLQRRAGSEPAFRQPVHQRKGPGRGKSSGLRNG